MPKFKDNVTGQVIEFDHEPSQQELDQKFGSFSAGMGPSFGGPKPFDPDAEKSAVAPGVGGMLGAVIGGKTPLGKIGAGVGAAAGTAYGDLYNMFTHGVGSTTPSSEAQRLATVAGVTSGLETAIPPVLRAVGSVKNLLPTGGGLLGGGGLGWLLGHPQAGAAAGAAIEAAPKVADAVDWLGTPAGQTAGNQARNAFMQDVPKSYANKPQVQAQASQIANEARAKAGGPLAEVPPYLQRQNWGASLRSAGNTIKDKASAALEGLEGMFGGGAAAPPTPPPSPARPGLQLTKTPGDIAERLGVTGQPVSSQVDISRNPEMRWSADVEAAPQRTPQLTQTSPTDPKMPWEEHMSRSAPKRTATGGQNWSTPAYDPMQATDPNTVMHGSGDPLKGLQGAAPEMSPVGPHDDGLQRWVEAGGTPETYARAKAGLEPNFSQGGTDLTVSPYGENTVGAAQRQRYQPSGVDDAEGLSLAEREAWAAHKQINPGTTDADLDAWYRANRLGVNPNEGMDINEMADKLTQLLKRQ